MPVTGSLLFATPGCCLSELSAGEIVLCVPRDSAELFGGIIIGLRWRWGATARQMAGLVTTWDVECGATGHIVGYG